MDRRASGGLLSRPRVRGQLLAIAATAIWSTNYVLGRALRNDVTPATIGMVRALVASVPLALWLGTTQGWPRLRGPALRQIFLLGFLGIFASQYLTYLGLHWSLATNATILNAASPLVTAALAAGAGLFTFSAALVAGLLISAAGAALVTALGAGTGMELRLDPGALCIIASMGTWAFYNLGVQRLRGALPPLWITVGAMLAGLPFLGAALVVEHPARLAASLRDHLPALLYLAVGPSALAYACWNAAVQEIGASYAMMFNNLLPIFGMLLGGLVLHERVTFVQLAASALIIVGILLAYAAFPSAAPAPAARPRGAERQPGPAAPCEDMAPAPSREDTAGAPAGERR